MPTQVVKGAIVSIGLVLALIGVVLLIYEVPVEVLGVSISFYAPFREYSLPLGITGAVLVTMGLALHKSSPSPAR